jgi:hypothetical protein
LNRVTKGLKEILCKTVEDGKEASEKPAGSGKEASKRTAKKNKKASEITAEDGKEASEITANDGKEAPKKKKWRTAGFFTCNGTEAEFGAGSLSLSVGTLNPGHRVCISTICGWKPNLSLY